MSETSGPSWSIASEPPIARNPNRTQGAARASVRPEARSGSYRARLRFGAGAIHGGSRVRFEIGKMLLLL